MTYSLVIANNPEKHKHIIKHVGSNVLIYMENHETYLFKVTVSWMKFYSYSFQHSMNLNTDANAMDIGWWKHLANTFKIIALEETYLLDGQESVG